MNISIVAAKSGVLAKTIRYYEGTGLLPPAVRTENGYRVYTEADIQTLRFIKRARHLGFTVEEVSSLLTLWRDRARTSAEVKALAFKRIGDIDRRLRELDGLKRVIQDLAQHCRGDDRPECPIIDGLARENTNIRRLDAKADGISVRRRSHSRPGERTAKTGHA